MRSLFIKLSNSVLLNLFVALICLCSGVSEIVTVAEETESTRMHAGHGLVAIGLWNALKALGEAFESFDYFAKASES
ncbi:MAG: hypothetical protein P8M73_08750 [Luminiphilus sp.]|jgi:hypothetical protein|nr:hypothetical protein [Luminiphilus sp.]